MDPQHAPQKDIQSDLSSTAPPQESSRTFRKKPTRLITAVVLISVLFGFLAGLGLGIFAYLDVKQRIEQVEQKVGIVPTKIIEKEYIPQSTQEQKIIDTVKNASPAVVSIIITKDVPIMEQFFTSPFEDIPGFQIPQFRENGTEKREIGGGSGFIISSDGLVVTNKHVVLQDDVEYTIFTNEGKSYPAQVLARDPLQDLAIIEIQHDGYVFPAVELGSSDSLEIGQTVVAIGNALGEFRNTVSVGVISGLGRTITASDGSGGFVETIEDVVQTDAAINRGNSGGPLLNLAGEVIGVNTATVLQAQNIGFAIPVNKVKRDVKQVQETGKIVYAFLGIRYTLINERIQEQEGLDVDHGALIGKEENGESAVMPESAAAEAGLQEGDIILEFNGEEITPENSLAKIIQTYDPDDTVTLKVLREGSILTLQATLGERSE